MSQQVRRWIPGGWGLWLLLLVMGLTWPQDDAGRSAAQCSFLGSAGTPTLCGVADPMPTISAGPTQSTTDPTGWGRLWFQSTGLNNNTAYVVLSAEGQTFYAVERAAADLRTFVSNNGGRTFALQDTTVGINVSGVNGSTRVSGGAFLIAASDPATNFPLLTSNSGFQWQRATRPPSGTCAAGSACPFFSVASQGNTVIASGNVARCRSTDGGASFTSCAVTAPRSNTFHTLASPAVNVWLGYDVGSDAVYRSTDDGVTWTAVVTAIGARGLVECLSPTICLAAGGTTIRRSTNAGATWTTIFTEPFSNNLTTLVSFGSGVVVAWSPNADRVYRSNDSGATWNFQVIGPDIDFGFTTGDYAGGVTLNGRGLLGGTGRLSTNGVAYSPVVGAGETIVAGQNGARWEIDALGAGEITIRDPVTGTAAGVTAAGRLSSAMIHATGGNGRACSTPAANTAATVSVAGVVNLRVVLSSYVAYYTTAPAAAQTLTVLDGATTTWQDIVNGANTPTRHGFAAQPLFGGTGNTVTVTLPAAGVGVSGVLCAVMDQYQQ